MSRVVPIPGTLRLEYRKGDRIYQRCSRCHGEREISPLVLSTLSPAFHPVMVGSDVLGILCEKCVHSTQRYILSIFPDEHAFPFVDEVGQLLPTPRCELGHPLVFTDDGRGMTCQQCDVPPPISDGE